MVRSSALLCRRIASGKTRAQIVFPSRCNSGICQTALGSQGQGIGVRRNMTEPKPKTGAGAIPKRDKPPTGTWVEREIIESDAFTGLPGKAPIVYYHFLLKRRKNKDRKGKWHWWNLRELTFSYREAEELGISNRAFNLAIDKLIEHGFIDIIEPGNGLVEGKCTLYGLSERWRKFGTPEFVPAKRKKAYYGHCSSEKRHTAPKKNCLTCFHSLGGQLQECVVFKSPVRADHKCQRYELWT